MVVVAVAAAVVVEVECGGISAPSTHAPHVHPERPRGVRKFHSAGTGAMSATRHPTGMVVVGTGPA